MNKKSLLAIFAAILMFSASHAQVYTHGFIHRSVALTFDDGPSPLYTEMILDILHQYGVTATFFLIGHKVAEHPEIAREIVDDGHEIGNHTYYHSHLNLVNGEKLLKEIKMTSDMIFEKTGKRTTLFRPPGGDLPWDKIRMIQNAGYDIIQWSVNADDYYHLDGGIHAPSRIAAHVIANTRGADIILMHDDSPQTVVALPRIIRALKRRGYNFVTVSKMIGRL